MYRYIRELENDRILQRTGHTLRFVQKYEHSVITLNSTPRTEEYEIFEEYLYPYIKDLPENVFRIWQYAFTEMMNNAIDHADADTVLLGIRQNYLTTAVLLHDNGIGIFRKLKEYFHYHSLDDAITALFKGKITTDNRKHSGEGIFFTSRMLDTFAAQSDGKIFSHDKYFKLSDDFTIKELNILIKGTTIFMELSNFSQKTPKEIFDMFSYQDHGFTKTRIPLKNIFDGYPVARSQAKRLYDGFEKFNEIELDFDGIDDLGQGFAHELFVVFQNEHPDILLTPLNMNANVAKMYQHVKA